MNQSRCEHSRSRWFGDGVIILVLLVGWVVLVGGLTRGRRTATYDTFRDMAWAENIRAGRIWSDPTLAELPAWYPPGGPLLVTAASILTGRPIVDVYGYASWWLNALLPVMLYLLARSAWDRTTAIVALLTVPLGSVWLLTHAVANVPSVQGTALSLLSLLGWHRCVLSAGVLRRGLCWSLATGLILALAAWFHPLCAIMPAAAIFLQVALNTAFPRRMIPGSASRRQVASCMLLAGLVAGVLSAPLLRQMLAGLRAPNPAPLLYFANDLDNPAYYAHAQAPLIVLAALAGIHFIVRFEPGTLWIVMYLLVGLLGQAAGYLRFTHGWPVPALLPHEFQWHGHLAVGCCAAVGIASLARALASRAAGDRRGSRIRTTVLWLTVLVAVTVGPALRWLPRAGMHLLDLEPLLTGHSELIEWIRADTTLDQVFVTDPDLAYMVVAGLTGRKCAAVPACHSNPRAEARRRLEDVERMLATSDAAEFARLAERYQAECFLILATPPGAARAVLGRYADWPFLRPVFVSSDATTVVFRIAHGAAAE